MSDSDYDARIADSLKIDEVKRLEKIYEFSKDIFLYSETLLKNLDEKSKNNINASTAIVAFGFIIRKPVAINEYSLLDLISVTAIVFNVVFAYYQHFELVKSRPANLPSSKNLKELFDNTIRPSGVLKSNFDNMQSIYIDNISLMMEKGKILNIQQRSMIVLLISVLAYVLLGGLPKKVEVSSSGRGSSVIMDQMTDNPPDQRPDSPPPTVIDPYTRPRPDFVPVNKGGQINEGNNTPPKPRTPEKPPSK